MYYRLIVFYGVYSEFELFVLAACPRGWAAFFVVAIEGAVASMAERPKAKPSGTVVGRKKVREWFF